MLLGCCCDKEPCPGFLYDRGQHEDDWEDDGGQGTANFTFTKEEDHLSIRLERTGGTGQNWQGSWVRIGNVPLENVHTIRVKWSLEVTGNEPPSYGNQLLVGGSILASRSGEFSEAEDFANVASLTDDREVLVRTIHRDQFGNIGGPGDETLAKFFEVECICD